ncbi:MAG TPA: hypothetical protein VLS51_06680 [Propionibacteriaceae bacterium]|nr:hypothetical protein [Propionibacteriaceae bacterium]
MLGDAPFRMPDSWYDPPDDRPDLVECPGCKGSGKVSPDEACATCEGTGEVEPPDDQDEPDPDLAYDEWRERRLEE